MGIEKCDLLSTDFIWLFSSMLDTYFNLWCRLPIGPPIVVQGKPPVLLQLLSLLVSFSSDDLETEHGKFVNYKLSMTDSVGCTYN